MCNSNAVEMDPWQWLVKQWVTSSVAANAASAVSHAPTGFTNSAVFTGAGSVVARIATPEINPRGVCEFMFAVGDSGGAPDGKTATVRIWGVHDLQIGNSLEEVAHYLGDLALVGGAGAIHADSELRGNLPTALNVSGSLGWVDTITVSPDEFPLPFGAVVDGDATDCKAVLRLSQHGYKRFVLEITVGTAEAVAAFMRQG